MSFVKQNRCVAIAGAQMLYWLHCNLGVPQTAPSQAYCNGNKDSYTFGQTNYTSTIWEFMDRIGLRAAPLIANVGKRVGMRYGNTGSAAQTSDLVDHVFAPYGIGCTYMAYNVDTLISHLYNGYPVIVRAKAKNKNYGHNFIVDQYLRQQPVYKRVYVWVYDTYPTGKPLPYVPDMTEAVYYSPTITRISMNWGWNKSDNYAWYGLTDDWIIHSDSGQDKWNVNRAMICNWSVLNN